MSEHYRREFDLWLEAFKQGDLFQEIVEGFDHDWSLIYKELHRIFKRNVWNQMLEQRARERDQYNECASIPRSRKARDIQDMFHRFETQNSLTHLGKVNELIP